MTTTYTRYFRWGLPDFLNSPWHEDWYALVNAMDRSLYSAIIAAGAVEWENSTAYEPGTMAIDPDLGTLWVCEVAHTSAVSPTTFAEDRTANPSFWSSLTPANEILDAVNRAEIAASQASGSLMQSQSAYRKLVAFISAQISGVATLISQATGIAQQAAGHATRARQSAQQAKTAQQQVQMVLSLAASYAAMAQQAKRKVAAQAALLGDDQIVLKSQAFN